MSQDNTGTKTAKRPAQDQTRLYHIFEQDADGNKLEGGAEHLVEAQNNNQAFRAAGVANFGVKVASTKDALRLI
jgi:hypothetical protein